MTWKTGADLSLSGLKRLRQTLLDRERHLESLYCDVFSDTFDDREFRRGDATALEEALDEARGQLDEISDEIGRLERDEWEEKASADLKLISRYAARRP